MMVLIFHTFFQVCDLDQLNVIHVSGTKGKVVLFYQHFLTNVNIQNGKTVFVAVTLHYLFVLYSVFQVFFTICYATF